MISILNELYREQEQYYKRLIMSFLKNMITAIMGNKYKTDKFVENIILQLSKEEAYKFLRSELF